MGRSCGNCRYREISANVEPCRSCRLSDMIHPNWTPDTTAAKRALNYVYGRANINMDITNDVSKYLKNDVEATMEMYLTGGRSNGKTLRTLDEAAKKIGCRVVAESWFKSVNMPGIEKVIFSGPCTIVLWDDNTKTVVRAQGDDVFDPEKGLAMAISKKALGNNGNYFDEFKKWLPEETAQKTKPCKDFECFTTLLQASTDVVESLKVKEEDWKKKLDDYIESLKVK